MYEQTGRFYAFFGPQATVAPAEQRFFAHWSAGKQRALDIGAGLCEPALMLARLGLEVLAVEPTPILAALAMDRLSRMNELASGVTLIEEPLATLNEPFSADLILLRSVLMLLPDEARDACLSAARRHSAEQAHLIFDVRTVALAWADDGTHTEEKTLGRTRFRRTTSYARETDGSTRVAWHIECERFGKHRSLAAESFHVRADTIESVQVMLARHHFALCELYGGYDLDQPYDATAPMIVAVARAV